MTTACILIGGPDTAVWQYIPEGMTCHYRTVFVFADGASLNVVHEYREVEAADTYRVFELVDSVVS